MADSMHHTLFMPHLAGSDEEQHDCRHNEECLEVADGAAAVVDTQPDGQAHNQARKTCQRECAEGGVGTNTSQKDY